MMEEIPKLCHQGKIVVSTHSEVSYWVTSQRVVRLSREDMPSDSRSNGKKRTFFETDFLLNVSRCKITS